MQVTGILLAAGSSRRFGGDKLTQPLADGEWLAGKACQNLLSSVDRVLAVVRPGQWALQNRLQQIGAEVLVCPHAEQGMGSSLAYAVSQSADAEAWLVALADMPNIALVTLQSLADALRQGTELIAPVCQQRRGHPVGFGKRFAQELMALQGDSGAKAILKRHADILQTWVCQDVGIFQDIDTLEDLCALLKH